MEAIGYSAFDHCQNLGGQLVIPAEVTSIGGVAFSVCNHLSTIVVLPATPPVLGDQAFLALGTNTVYVGDLANYPEGWGGFVSVKSVGELEGTIKDDALAAISQAAQGMTLTPTETTVVNGHKAQILASVLVYAIEAAESMADSQIWVWKNFHVGVGTENM